jgi:hypothetical protein
MFYSLDGQRTPVHAGSRRTRALGTLLLLAACSGGSDERSSTSRDEAPAKERLPPCEAGEQAPCGTFITRDGLELALGEYGVVMEPNVGEGFENTINPFDSDGNLTCEAFSTTFFGDDAPQFNRLLDTGDLAFDLYTVYRPAEWAGDAQVPIVLWGNGTCTQPESYGALLRHVASHGFFVIAPNSRWVGSGNELLRALDFAIAANKDPASPYHQRLDPRKVAVMGHSQGSSGAIAAAKDVRVKLAVLFNSGLSASKPFLTVSGEYDILDEGPDPFAAVVADAPRGAYLYYRMVPLTGEVSGHLTLILQPERVLEPITAYLDYMLNEDAESGAWFLSDDCKLCAGSGEYEFGQRGL